MHRTSGKKRGMNTGSPAAGALSTSRSSRSYAATFSVSTGRLPAGPRAGSPEGECVSVACMQPVASHAWWVPRAASPAGTSCMVAIMAPCPTSCHVKAAASLRRVPDVASPLTSGPLSVVGPNRTCCAGSLRAPSFRHPLNSLDLPPYLRSALSSPFWLLSYRMISTSNFSWTPATRLYGGFWAPTRPCSTAGKYGIRFR